MKPSKKPLPFLLISTLLLLLWGCGNQATQPNSGKTDNTPPTVSRIDFPTDTAHKTLVISFSEPMVLSDAAYQNAWLELSGDTAPLVQGSPVPDSAGKTFTVWQGTVSYLVPKAVYRIKINAGLQDTAANILISFTQKWITGPVIDSIMPSPDDSLSTEIETLRVDFIQPVTSESLSGFFILKDTVTDSVVNLTASRSLTNDSEVVLIPANRPLQSFHYYKLIIKEGIQTTDSIYLPADSSYVFHTGLDTTAPRVLSIFPFENSGVGYSGFSLNFSEPVNCDSTLKNVIALTLDGTALSPDSIFFTEPRWEGFSTCRIRIKEDSLLSGNYSIFIADSSIHEQAPVIGQEEILGLPGDIQFIHQLAFQIPPGIQINGVHVMVTEMFQPRLDVQGF